MINFLTHAWWLILVLGVLITFHEFGHFWIARKAGVKVQRFSVGFGRPLFTRKDKHGTEFVIAALPLGGYVKMLDEREAPVATHELDGAFNRKSLGARSAIIAAGPIFNLIFAFFAFWVMFLIGIDEPKTIVGTPTGLAAEAGIEPGDQIVAIDDRKVETWTHVLLGLIGTALDSGTASIETQNENGIRKTHSLNFANVGEKIDEPRLLTQIGLNPWRPTFALRNELGAIGEGMPAEQAGLRAGDEIVQIAGQPVADWNEIVSVLDTNAKPGEPLMVRYLRDGTARDVSITPVSVDAGGQQRTQIGIGPVQTLTEQEQARFDAEWDAHSFIWRHGPISAVGASLDELWQFTTGTLGMLGRMITGKASLQNLSGPITIASLAKRSADLGLTTFLRLLALISLSLAILNLLPIPMLDGGLLFYNLIEWLTGKPVSENIQMIGQGIGVLMLACLMGLAFYNDIARLVS